MLHGRFKMEEEDANEIYAGFLNGAQRVAQSGTRYKVRLYFLRKKIGPARS
jgi:hypothetical protein